MPGWYRPLPFKIAVIATLALLVGLVVLLVSGLQLIETAVTGPADIMRGNRVWAGVAIAAAMFFLGVLGYWLARELRQLHRATRSIASGNLSVQLPAGTGGELATSLNAIVAKLAERVEALRQSESRFHAIADYTYSWETWLNAEGRLIWTNSSVERVTGYTAVECLLAQDFPKFLVHPDDWPKVRDRYAAFPPGARGQDFEYRILRKDGKTIWVASSWQPIHDEDGTNLGTRESVLENQGRKEAELKLTDTVNELQRSQALQTRY